MIIFSLVNLKLYKSLNKNILKIESLIESIESQLNIIVSDILSKSVEGFYSKQFNTKDLKAYEYNKNRQGLV